MAKKKNRSHRKKKLADAKDVKEISKSKEEKLNPFELKLNRVKRPVVGKVSRRFEKGFPGMSKLKAIEKRKTTLLQDYMKTKRSNKFVDRRIGENEADLSIEDKMMARFAAERQRSRKDIGSLDDNVDLTHYGHNLASIEKFDVPLSDDDDEEEKLNEEFVSNANFGGFLTKKDPEQAASSREKIIAEIVLKSKERKELKQKEKETSEVYTEQLNDEWKNVQSLLSSFKATKVENESGKRNLDNYDLLVRQLKFESRASASDPLKTAEQLAKKQKRENDKLEEKLLKRMKMEEKVNRFTTHRSADDLDDDFYETSVKKVKHQIEELIQEDDDESEQSEGEEHEKKLDDEEVLETLENFIKYCAKNQLSAGNVASVESIKSSFTANDADSVMKLLSDLYNAARRSPSKCADLLIELMKQKREILMKSSRRKPINSSELSEMVMIYKTVGLLFPMSDFRHPVGTLAMLLMAETILKLDIKLASHVFAGLYLCFLFLEFTQLSKRHVPECFVFLSNILESLTKKIISSNSNSDASQSTTIAETRFVTLNNCVTLLDKLLQLQHLSFYGQFLDGIKSNVTALEAIDLPLNIKKNLKSLSERIQVEKTFKRKKLIQDNSKRFSVKTFEPKLVQEDKKKLSSKQLVRKHHREMKGAMREIRKDNMFVASLQMKEQNDRDQARKMKLRQLYHDVAAERGLYKEKPPPRKR